MDYDDENTLDLILDTSEHYMELMYEQCVKLRAALESSEKASSRRLQLMVTLENHTKKLKVEHEKVHGELVKKTKAARNSEQALLKSKNKIAEHEKEIAKLEKTISELKNDTTKLKEERKGALKAQTELQKKHAALQKDHSKLKNAPKTEQQQDHIYLEIARRAIAAPAGANFPSEALQKIFTLEKYIKDLEKENDVLRAKRQRSFELYIRLKDTSTDDVPGMQANALALGESLVV